MLISLKKRSNAAHFDIMKGVPIEVMWRKSGYMNSV